MTKLYRFGTPFKSGATVKEMAPTTHNHFLGNNLQVESCKISFELRLSDLDIVLGLGEMLGGLNRRGKKYRCYATDDSHHTPEKESLYSSHPFVMIVGAKTTTGIFVDFPGEIIFDIGQSKHDLLKIEISSASADIYWIEGRRPRAVVAEFLSLVGKPWAPPRWAFGYQQSRWSYPTADKIREIVDSFAKYDLPLDTISMDIDYMDNFKVFTISAANFPHFSSFVAEMRERGIKLIPILDPGVKIESGYSIYEEGIEQGHFCQDSAGRPFPVAVWPGLTHLPDFFNESVRNWWGKKVAELVRMGVAGFWTDMNEPAIFFSKQGVERGLNLVENFSKKYFHNNNYSFDDYFAARSALSSASNASEDFKSFYHVTGQGIVNHHEVHNLFGSQMVAAIASGFAQATPDRRHYILSRSSYIGMHRQAALWTGDNASWWEHLALNLKMLMSLNMCGFFFVGADIGGFNANASPELFVRWMQLAIISPLFRNHSSIGTRNQEPWEFGDKILKIVRQILKLRYALIPYLYSEYMKARENSIPFLRPLIFDYERDTIAQRVEDQVLIGESLMMAPVISANATGRFVYLPQHRWLRWHGEKKKCQVLLPGTHYLPASLKETLFFIKENSCIALTSSLKNLDNYRPTVITVVGFVVSDAIFSLYEDDGVSNSVDHSIIKVQIVRKKIRMQLIQKGRFLSSIKRIHFKIYDAKGQMISSLIKMSECDTIRYDKFDSGWL